MDLIAFTRIYMDLNGISWISAVLGGFKWILVDFVDSRGKAPDPAEIRILGRNH